MLQTRIFHARLTLPSNSIGRIKWFKWFKSPPIDLCDGKTVNWPQLSANLAFRCRTGNLKSIHLIWRDFYSFPYYSRWLSSFYRKTMAWLVTSVVKYPELQLILCPQTSLNSEYFMEEVQDRTRLKWCVVVVNILHSSGQKGLTCLLLKWNGKMKRMNIYLFMVVEKTESRTRSFCP